VTSRFFVLLSLPVKTIKSDQREDATPRNGTFAAFSRKKTIKSDQREDATPRNGTFAAFSRKKNDQVRPTGGRDIPQRHVCRLFP